VYVALAIYLIGSAELRRFPPREQLECWSWQCWRCKERCEEIAGLFPGQGWRRLSYVAEGRSFAVYRLVEAHDFPTERLTHLRRAYESLGERWYYAPFLIGCELFNFLPTESQ